MSTGDDTLPGQAELDRLLPGGPWSTAEVAQASGVTSRTLRHYDAVGLLRPVGTDHRGQRLYGAAELLRLQQVLVLRTLGLSLPDIERALRDDGTGRTRVIRDHLDRLLAEQDRLGRLIATVTSTLESLEGGTSMTTDELYDGFDHRRYEAEARERWGEEAVTASTRTWEQMTDEQRRAHQAEAEAISRTLADLMAAEVPAADPRTLGAVRRHHAWVALFWSPDPAAYRALAQMYMDDPRFTATYDAVAPGLAAYLHDAVHAHADQVAAD